MGREAADWRKGTPALREPKHCGGGTQHTSPSSRRTPRGNSETHTQDTDQEWGPRGGAQATCRRNAHTRDRLQGRGLRPDGAENALTGRKQKHSHTASQWGVPKPWTAPGGGGRQSLRRPGTTLRPRAAARIYEHRRHRPRLGRPKQSQTPQSLAQKPARTMPPQAPHGKAVSL